jgi:GR25 family glycosyltransferase involved in LPS biosynthesis
MNEIEHILYINLDERTDRKRKVENELLSIGFACENIERFPACKLANGAIGCSMSHLKCLKMAKERGWDYVVIVEDDIQFLNPELFRNQFLHFLEKENREFDVVLLAGNNVPPYEKLEGDDSCIKVGSCQTTTGYMVKKHYYDTLIENIKEGMGKLLKNPENHREYAIDKYWFSLQKRDNWYLIVPLSVTQRPNYSNVENKETDYSHLMLDLEKDWYINQFKAK